MLEEQIKDILSRLKKLEESQKETKEKFAIIKYKHSELAQHLGSKGIIPENIQNILKQ